MSNKLCLTANGWTLISYVDERWLITYDNLFIPTVLQHDQPLSLPPVYISLKFNFTDPMVDTRGSQIWGRACQSAVMGCQKLYRPSVEQVGRPNGWSAFFFNCPGRGTLSPQWRLLWWQWALIGGSRVTNPSPGRRSDNEVWGLLRTFYVVSLNKFCQKYLAPLFHVVVKHVFHLIRFEICLMSSLVSNSALHCLKLCAVARRPYSWWKKPAGLSNRRGRAMTDCWYDRWEFVLVVSWIVTW